MVEYEVKFTKLAWKQKKLISNSNLEKNVNEILNLMIKNPFCYPPSYEKLSGNLDNYYSRRINSQNRLVYRVDELKKEIYIISMWTHYEKVKI